MEKIIFESGATTAASNNLVLSVMNDGNAYRNRLHCAWADLQGANHGSHSFRSMANYEAIKQRAEFGSKFKPAEITEAAKIIRDDTLQECIETLRNNYDASRSIIANGRKWRDNINGNTYFSVRLYIPQTDTPSGRIINIPFQYGYGDQWQWETRKVLENIGIIEKTDKYSRELPIEWIFDGVMLKRDMFDGIYL